MKNIVFLQSNLTNMKRLQTLSIIALSTILMGAFFSCKSHKNVTQPAVEAAAPQGPAKPQPISGVPPLIEYIVKGKVTTAKGKPVPGMQVILLHSTIPVYDGQPSETEYTKQLMAESTAITNEKGQFECHLKDVHNLSERIFVRDIDGPANDTYESVIVEIPFTLDDIVVNGQGQRTGTSQKEVSIIVKKK